MFILKTNKNVSITSQCQKVLDSFFGLLICNSKGSWIHHPPSLLPIIVIKDIVAELRITPLPKDLVILRHNLCFNFPVGPELRIVFVLSKLFTILEAIVVVDQLFTGVIVAQLFVVLIYPAIQPAIPMSRNSVIVVVTVRMVKPLTDLETKRTLFHAPQIF